LRNLSAEPIDLGGIVVKDDNDSRDFAIATGTIIPPHGYHVLDEADFGFGLGKADSARIFAADGTTLIDEFSWTAHGAPAWARTEAGEWQQPLNATKGGKNRFEGDPVWVSGNLVINEAESSGGTPGDWIEFLNIGDEPVDVGGHVVKDDKDDNTYTFPEGTIVAPGEFLVIDELQKNGAGDFDFGLGKADAVRLFERDGTTLIEQRTWEAHAAHTYGRDADGEWRETAESTKGAANVFPEDVHVPQPGALVLNEIDSAPADWLEFVNPGDEPLDVSGYEIRDNSDDHRWRFPAGTSILPGEFLVVDAKQPGLIWDQATDTWVESTFEAAIGIGSNDSIRVYDADGALIDEHSWQGHAAIDGDELAATLARCPDGIGAFALAHATKGAANECVPPTIVINEVESNGGVPGDWAEIKNIGDAPVDISGWTLMDNDPVGHADGVVPLPAGTVLQPGEYFVFDENVHFTFGLGANDQVTIRDAQGLTVAEYAWTVHANGTYGRCPDGTGEFREIETPTRGELNSCGNRVVLNEVESKDGEPGDWIELHNPTADELDIAGLVVKDDRDDHAYEIPAGTVIAPGGYLVLEEADFGFGLGGADSVRIFDGEHLIQATSWTEHADTTWGRCPNATGEFAVTAVPTKGERNECVGDVDTIAWPGADDVRVVDDVPIFLQDSSGLEFVEVGDGGHLYAVDNGTGIFWRLDVAADGTLTLSDEWAPGKRVRFQADADDPAAAGPDAEGITVDGTGMLFIASERDNSDKGVNKNTVLMVDPEAPGPDLVALIEWEITDVLPAVGPNLGVEAIEWVPDEALAGAIWDDALNKPYDPADYPDRRAGLYLAGVEANGLVYALALADDGSAVIVSTIDPKLGSVMALDHDPVLGVLWAMCDDGCDGLGAQIPLQSGLTAPELDVLHVERPTTMPNINNEGFATSTICVDGQRSAWWFVDGVDVGSLRTDLPAGPLDYATLHTVQPYGDRLYLVTLTGEELHRAFDHFADDIGDNGPAVSANVRYTVDTRRPAGSRVTDLHVDGEPVDPAREYTVVANEFLTSPEFGGSPLASLDTRREADLTDIEALIRYVSQEGPIHAPEPGRVRVLR